MKRFLSSYKERDDNNNSALILHVITNAFFTEYRIKRNCEGRSPGPRSTKTPEKLFQNLINTYNI